MLGDLQIGRITRFLQKWSGIKGKGLPTSLSSEISVELAIFSGLENLYLEGWGLFGFNLNQNAGGVGNINQYRFRNPTASKMIAVFTAISFGNTSAVTDAPQLQIGPIGTDFGTIIAVPTGRLDPRGSPNPALIVSEQQAAIASLNGVIKQIILPSSAPFGEFLSGKNEIPLLPGDALQINSNNTNAENFCAVMFRQRALEDSELT